MPRSTATMIGSTCRCSSVAMMAQVTSGRFKQLDMALRDEIRADPRRDFAGAVRVLLGKPDPLHRGMAVRHLAAEQPDAAAADDGETDFCGLCSHFCIAGLSPALYRAFRSAIAATVSLVSGRFTGSPRSAERSAAE